MAQAAGMQRQQRQVAKRPKSKGVRLKLAQRTLKRKKATRPTLGDELEDPGRNGVRVRPRAAKRQRLDPDEEEEVITEEQSARVLREARAQQAQLEAEDSGIPLGDPNSLPHSLHGDARPAAAGLGAYQGQLAELGSPSEEEEEGDGEGEGGLSVGRGYSPEDERWIDEEVAAEDEEALARFMGGPPGGGGSKPSRTLADVISQRLRERQEGVDAPQGRESGGLAEPQALDPRALEVFKGVGQVLSRFTSGKVPKAFKVVPNLRNWEEVLLLTDPENWSPHAVYQATRLFVSNLNARQAQRFVALVLLPRVRRDIQEHKRLHFALFEACKKAAFKPDAFFKGLLLPLCQVGDASLREAVILSSVMRRVSIPLLHSAAALLRLADLPYAGTTSFFIRVLLDKKYALPYRVLDALVDHFLRFRTEDRVLPVVWHQALLCFVQRYKREIRVEDKEALRRLLRHQHHHLVSPEVLRELNAPGSRGEKAAAPATPTKPLARAQESYRDMPPVVLMEED